MLNIATFGGNTTRVRHVDRSTIYVKTDDNEIIPLSVLVVPTIAKPIDTSLMSVAATFPYLRRLKLAQPVSVDSMLDIAVDSRRPLLGLG
ncbi:hypothetical protein DPMN_064996 [Dreissena polymorpha]|uniref:Uncharacterized protein n=1 Tax=Dreissena polymorpha TaxID=45954 RepID=A0A9D4CE69_DREPO|nr:hypothetical protein DPMN_064996 [Dreissena polymorpha]